MDSNKEQTTKEKKKLPYRFTCAIPCEVVGHRELSKREKEEAKKIHKQLMKQFNLEKEETNN